MRGMPFNLQGKGVLEVEGALGGAGEEGGVVFWGGVASLGGGGGFKRKKGVLKEAGSEPRSVLDTRRSPSPPTSTSTLSSSLGGGGGSSDTAGVAALSDSNPAHKWPTSDSNTTGPVPPTSASDDGAGSRREEWAAELQPIPSTALEAAGKCSGGVEDWETMLSEPAASPGQEQTFLRWIMGDIDDPSKQQLLSQPSHPDLGFGLVDPGFGFEAMTGIGPPISNPMAINSSMSSGITTSIPGFPPLISSNSSSNRLIPSPSSQTSAGGPLSSIKVPSFSNQAMNPVFSPTPSPTNLPLSLQPGMFFAETMEEKPQFYTPGLLQAQATQNPAFFLPLPSYVEHQQTPQLLLPPQPKRHQPDPTAQLSPKISFPDPAGPDLFLRRNNPQPPQHSPPQLHSIPFHLQQRAMKPKAAAAGDEAAMAAAAHQQHQQQQQQALVDQLFKAAELVEAGNSVSARGILARLNHQLPSPLGKPLVRSAFYYKEALHLLLSSPPGSPSQRTSLSTPLDVVLKLSAYKAFSEVSPLLQFTNFTCVQALLDEFTNTARIHVVDFDIGVGGQWSSFMQELAQRRCNSNTPATPSLKISAFVSPASHHPLELHLTRDNLVHFAADLGIPFEFNIMPLDAFDPAAILEMSNDEAIAVNLPVGSSNPSIPTIVRLVKQLSPKIVVSVDQGCDRSDLPFSHHFLHSLQSSMVLLDSIDAAGTIPDVANKIERFLLQPRIESAVLGRQRAAEKMLPWRTLFSSAGFVPVQFSNFTETQAECLLKRVQVRGFHVEKRQASLHLYWQRGELVSVSAWRC